LEPRRFSGSLRNTGADHSGASAFKGILLQNSGD
jgi:hypothetical protein